MNGMQKRKQPPQHRGTLSPLDFAVTKHAQGTMETVKEAIAHNQTLLAFQPIMRSDALGQVGFYEGLIRVLDAINNLQNTKIQLEQSKFIRENEIATLSYQLQQAEQDYDRKKQLYEKDIHRNHYLLRCFTHPARLRKGRFRAFNGGSSG